MTADAVIRVKVKAVLLVAVWIITNPIIAIDIQAFPTQSAVFRRQFDRLAVSIFLLGFFIPQKSIFGFVAAYLKHGDFILWLIAIFRRMNDLERASLFAHSGGGNLIFNDFDIDGRLFKSRLPRMGIKQT